MFDITQLLEKTFHIYELGKVIVEDTKGFSNAQVASGGIDTRNINRDTIRTPASVIRQMPVVLYGRSAPVL